MTNKNAEPLIPVELGAGKVKFAQGIKAGRWVFATGVMAQDFKNGIAPDVLSERADSGFEYTFCCTPTVRNSRVWLGA